MRMGCDYCGEPRCPGGKGCPNWPTIEELRAKAEAVARRRADQEGAHRDQDGRFK